MEHDELENLIDDLRDMGFAIPREHAVDLDRADMVADDAMDIEM